MNKTSARNFYPGTVASIKKGGVNSDVKIDLTSGIELSAIVTNQSLSKMKLKKGKSVYSLFKASSVIVTTDERLIFSTRNRMWGKVTRIKKGAVNSEVVIEIQPHFAVVAVITNESIKQLKLKKNMKAGALIKASQVILATF